MSGRIDIAGLVEELERVSRMIERSTTNEERVFLHMRLIHSGHALVEKASANANALTQLCVDSLDPVVVK